MGVLLLGMAIVVQRSDTRDAARYTLAGVAVDTAHARHACFYVQRLQFAGIDAAYATVSKLYVVGHAANRYVAHAAVDNFYDVGIQAVHVDACCTAVLQSYQVAGVYTDLHTLGMYVYRLLRKADVQPFAVALKLVELYVVVWCSQLYKAALCFVLYQLHMAHASHLYFLEGFQFVLLGYNVVTGVNQISITSVQANTTRCQRQYAYHQQQYFFHTFLTL